MTMGEKVDCTSSSIVVVTDNKCCRELVMVKTSILMLTDHQFSYSSLIAFGRWPHKYVIIFITSILRNYFNVYSIISLWM